MTATAIERATGEWGSGNSAPAVLETMDYLRLSYMAMGEVLDATTEHTAGDESVLAKLALVAYFLIRAYPGNTTRPSNVLDSSDLDKMAFDVATALFYGRAGRVHWSQEAAMEVLHAIAKWPRMNLYGRLAACWHNDLRAARLPEPTPEPQLHQFDVCDLTGFPVPTAPAVHLRFSIL